MTLLSELSGPERDAVLAGLRLLQQNLMDGDLDDEIGVLYTNCNEHMGMNLVDIDSLCERVNT